MILLYQLVPILVSALLTNVIITDSRSCNPRPWYWSMPYVASPNTVSSQFLNQIARTGYRHPFFMHMGKRHVARFQNAPKCTCAMREGYYYFGSETEPAYPSMMFGRECLNSDTDSSPVERNGVTFRETKRCELREAQMGCCTSESHFYCKQTSLEIFILQKRNDSIVQKESTNKEEEDIRLLIPEEFQEEWMFVKYNLNVSCELTPK